ncbi:MAG: 2-hydroxychromene-2-carboxylate isomerase [Myxococcota bacterium]
MSKTLEFFFDYTSPYSYLASTQIEAIATRTKAELVWRPFLLGGVFKATGNQAPYLNPHKAVYLAKDLLDWARLYGLPDLILPESFPANSLAAGRLGLVALEHGKLPAFTHAMYRRVFVRGDDPADEHVLTEVLREVGIEPAAALERAKSQDIKDVLRKNTDEAVARGAFGAPVFFIGEEMYLGNDRLHFVERALEGKR